MFALATIAHNLGLSSFPLLKKFGYEVMYRFHFRDLQLTKIISGSLLYVYPNSPVGKACISSGIWEPGTTTLISRILRKGWTFVDVGANVGYYTTLAAGLVGKEGKVVAFEPDPANYEILCRNVHVNRFANVICERYAISNRTGIRKLWLNPFDPGAHSLFHDDLGHYETVRTISLDEYFDSGNGPLKPGPYKN